MTDPSNLRADQLRAALERWATGKFEIEAVLIDTGAEPDVDQTIWDAVDTLAAAARSFLAVLEGPTDE